MKIVICFFGNCPDHLSHDTTEQTVYNSLAGLEVCVMKVVHYFSESFKRRLAIREHLWMFGKVEVLSR